MSTRVVFIRVGWMRYYGQEPEHGGPVGGGSFNVKDRGSEVENFRDRRGICYGYAQVARSGAGFNLERVAGRPVDGDDLSDVLVISVATRRGVGQVVVGWHGHATLYRHTYDRPRHGYGGYNFEAPASRAVLLPEASRTWPVPKGLDGMGQANVFYVLDAAGHRRRDRWIRSVLANIAAHGHGRSRHHRLLSPEAEEGKRIRIEMQRAERDPALVRACLARDGHRCRHCGFADDNRRFPNGPDGLSGLLHVHHTRPIADGKRRTKLGDLLTLCPTCHAVGHAIARSIGATLIDLALLRRFYRSVTTRRT